MKIRDITDPKELLQAQIDEVRRGNLRMREKIKNCRAVTGRVKGIEGV